VTLHWALGLFFAFLGFVALGGFAQFWILVEMTEQVNQKKHREKRWIRSLCPGVGHPGTASCMNIGDSIRPARYSDLKSSH
jgi:hypothetical protein